VVQFYLVTDLQSKTRKCLRVQAGDRLGVYSEYDMSSLCYQFTNNPTHVDTSIHVFDNVSYPVSGSSEAVVFDDVVHPYTFFAEAHFYYGKTCLRGSLRTVRAEPETVISRAWVQSPDPAELINCFTITGAHALRLISRTGKRV